MIDSFSGRARIGDIKSGTLPQYADARGVLGVVDFAKAVPVLPVRLFWITEVPAGTARGGHAHKRCAQFMICMGGQIVVGVFDGVEERDFDLKAGDYIHVPPGIFATETFLAPHSHLLVLCDQPYDPDDYIDDRSALVPGA